MGVVAAEAGSGHGAVARAGPGRGVDARRRPVATGCEPCDECDEDHWRPDTQAPAAPSGLWSMTGDREIRLMWIANAEADLDGYRIYRSTEPNRLFPAHRHGRLPGHEFHGP